MGLGFCIWGCFHLARVAGHRTERGAERLCHYRPWSTPTLGFAVSGVSCHGEATLGHMRCRKQKLVAMSK